MEVLGGGWEHVSCASHLTCISRALWRRYPASASRRSVAYTDYAFHGANDGCQRVAVIGGHQFVTDVGRLYHLSELVTMRRRVVSGCGHDFTNCGSLAVAPQIH
jgi:hypothetical protein